MKKFKIISFCVFFAIVVSGCAATKPSLTDEQNQTLIEILSILSETIAETEEILKTNTDPTNQYVDILDRLNFMKEIISQIKAGNAPYDEKLIEKYTNKIREIEANIRNAVDEVFSGDVVFGLGKYQISDLSEEGKKSLNHFTETIIDSQVKIFRKMFPDRQLIIVIKAVGYADEIPLGPELSEVLKKEIDSLPEDPVERKKEFNKKLSFLRAQSIFEYIKMQLQTMLEMENILISEPEIKGLGEEFPYSNDSVNPPYESEDDRRRICKIYSQVIIDTDFKIKP